MSCTYAQPEVELENDEWEWEWTHATFPLAVFRDDSALFSN